MKRINIKAVCMLLVAVLCAGYMLTMCSCSDMLYQSAYEYDREHSTKSSPVSYDEKYRLVVEFEDNVKYVKVYSNDDSKNLIYTVPGESGYPADIGYPIEVYWGKNNYDFFILSGDMGVCMLKYENGIWSDKYILKIRNDQTSARIVDRETIPEQTMPYDIDNIPDRITEYYSDMS